MQNRNSEETDVVGNVMGQLEDVLKITKEKQRKKINYREAGITLVALVVTIIVLLILAGISISMLLGDNGILQRTIDSKEKTTVAGEKEQLQLEVLGSYETNGSLIIETVNTNIKNHISGVTTDDATEFPLTVTFTATGNRYEINGNGNVETPKPSVKELVKVGDYVDYDPTKSDAAKMNIVDDSKLKYESPVGTGKSHGNGYAKQTYEATSSVNWRVLSITDNKIELISEDTIKKNESTDYNGNFVLNGAIGYLYAEQELNEICKIYGYGYGADLDSGGTYKVGGPYDTLITGKIEETGARSIKIEDLNKIANVGETKDDPNIKKTFVELDSYYGSTSRPTSNIYYPTITTDSGRSSTAGAKNLEYTYYAYNRSMIADTDIQNMLFKDNYWLSSRAICVNNNVAASFFIHAVINDNKEYDNLFYCTTRASTTKDCKPTDCSIRPLVTLTSKTIDLDNPSSTRGTKRRPLETKISFNYYIFK